MDEEVTSSKTEEGLSSREICNSSGLNHGFASIEESGQLMLLLNRDGEAVGLGLALAVECQVMGYREKEKEREKEGRREGKAARYRSLLLSTIFACRFSFNFPGLRRERETLSRCAFSTDQKSTTASKRKSTNSSSRWWPAPWWGLHRNDHFTSGNFTHHIFIRLQHHHIVRTHFIDY